MPDLKKIRICFDNCDCVTVERKDLQQAYMERDMLIIEVR